MTKRFWQWNRYMPLATCNAAVRNGAWKLIRPAIREAMRVAPADLEIDRRLKYEPEAITDISRTPEPPREVPPSPPPLLFNIEEDPYEQADLAAAQPQRVATLLRELEEWFAAVEAERRNITA
jgi:arylsulfatase A